MFKVGLDRILAAVGLAMLASLVLLIAIAIRLDSRGPLLIRPARVGAGGKEFTMYTFRTMVLDAERRLPDLAGHEVNQRLLTLRRDPRVTRVLRRYSLDELPQVGNLLQGRMSLMGPRPSLPAEVAQPEHDETRRLRVRPGYVDNWSPALDTQIRPAPRGPFSWERERTEP